MWPLSPLCQHYSVHPTCPHRKSHIQVLTLVHKFRYKTIEIVFLDHSLECLPLDISLDQCIALQCEEDRKSTLWHLYTSPSMLYCVQLLYVFLLWKGCVIYQTLESNWTKVVLDLDMSIWFNI